MGWTSLVRLSDSSQAGLEAISWCRDGRLLANRAATSADTNAAATATCRALLSNLCYCDGACSVYERLLAYFRDQAPHAVHGSAAADSTVGSLARSDCW